MWRSWWRGLYTKSLFKALETQFNSLSIPGNKLLNLKVSDQLNSELNHCTIWRHKHLEASSEIEVVAKPDLKYLPDYEGDIKDSRICPAIGELSKALSKELFRRFALNKAEINHVLSTVKTTKYNYALANLEMLCSEGLNKDSLIYCPWMLNIETKILEANIKLLKSIKGIRNFNDFVPFLAKSTQRLGLLIKIMNQDSSNMDCGNRCYYLAETLKVEPFLVNLYVARRNFILEMNWNAFKANLQSMLDFNIEPLNILKDLWSFRYHPQVVRMRLQKTKSARKKRIKPWVVRCSETILKRSLQMSSDGFDILGEHGTPTEYIAQRLGYTTDEAQAIMDKHPQVNTVRVTKIKEVFDYLLNEAGFSCFEVANVPRILCHSLKTTKQRLEELKSYGCRPISLVIVCRSKREYNKFLNQWLQSQGQTRKDVNAKIKAASTNTTED